MNIYPKSQASLSLVSKRIGAHYEIKKFRQLFKIITYDKGRKFLNSNKNTLSWVLLSMIERPK